jgi:hypothetical protein
MFMLSFEREREMSQKYLFFKKYLYVVYECEKNLTKI